MILGSPLIKHSSRPKFKRVFGRTWGECTVILPSGRKITGYLDYTWGRWIHFSVHGEWYKTSVDNMANHYIADLREEEEK